METPSRIAELERKFEENPRRYFAALANEYRKAGEIKRAIELCERHLAEQHNHLSGHVVLAQALVDSGRDADAWEPLHTALDLDPENFIALRLLGELSARAGDADQARGYFFRALEIEPRNDQILDALKGLSQLRGDGPGAPDAARTVPAVGKVPTLAPFPETSVTEAAEAAAEPAPEPAPQAPPLVHDMWGDLQIATPDEADRAASLADDVLASEEAEPAHADEVAEPAAVVDQSAVVPDESDWAETPAEAEPVIAGEDVWNGWDIPVPVDEGAKTGVEDGAKTGQEGEAEEEITVGDVAQPGYFSLSDEFAVPPPVAPRPVEEPGLAVEPAPGAMSPAAEITDVEREAEAVEVSSSVESFADVEGAVDAASQPPDVDARELEREQSAESRPTLVSETMVELYLAQGHATFALEALRELVASRPDDERLRARLDELERSVAPQPKETVRDLFARLGRGRSRAAQAATALAGAFAQVKDDGPVARLFGGEGASDLGDNGAFVAVLDDSPTDVPDDAAFAKWLREPRT